MLMTNEDIQIVSQLEMDMLFFHENANDDFAQNNINDQSLGIEMRIVFFGLYLVCLLGCVVCAFLTLVVSVSSFHLQMERRKKLTKNSVTACAWTPIDTDTT